VAPQGPNVVLLRPPVIALDPAEPPRDYEYRSDRVHPGRVLNLLHALAGEAAGRALEPFLP
jgi:hypothetical protein